MNTNNYRAPLALALVAMFAMSLAPVSGAESQTTVYTFETGGDAPRWTILKLEVTEPGIEPRILFESDAFRCPSYWSAWFLQGTPDDAESIGSFGFVNAVGRHGAHAVIESPLANHHHPHMTNDGEESCLWFNIDIGFGELPLGSVYLLHLTAGVPFTGSATLSVDRPGISIVGISSGYTSIYKNETNFANGNSVVAHGPPFCGGPTEVLDCPSGHYNPGGHFGAALATGRTTYETFKHHPFVRMVPRGTLTFANASVVYPDGSVYYLEGEELPATTLEMDPRQLMITRMGAPSGQYQFRVDASAHVGVLSYTGWHLMGADIWFPDEQR